MAMVLPSRLEMSGMRSMIKILELAKTQVVVRVYFGVQFHTEIEILCGFGDNGLYGRYHLLLRGNTLAPPSSSVSILDYGEAAEIEHSWVHGGGRDWAPDDFRWLEAEPFVATSVGSNSLSFPNRGALGPYHETSQQILAMLVVQLLNDYTATEDTTEEAFYETVLIRLRSMLNKINDRQSEHGAYPTLLFAKSRDTEF